MRVFEVLREFDIPQSRRQLAPIDFTKPLTLRALNRAKFAIQQAAIEAKHRECFLAIMYGDGVTDRPDELDTMKIEKTQLDIERKRIGLRIDRLRLVGQMSKPSEPPPIS